MARDRSRRSGRAEAGIVDEDGVLDAVGEVQLGQHPADLPYPKVKSWK
ncbi:hypothetical protein ACGFIV_28465 [Sphaerisporangium sp. NPDC049003]